MKQFIALTVIATLFMGTSASASVNPYWIMQGEVSQDFGEDNGVRTKKWQSGSEWVGGEIKGATVEAGSLSDWNNAQLKAELFPERKEGEYIVREDEGRVLFEYYSHRKIKKEYETETWIYNRSNYVKYCLKNGVTWGAPIAGLAVLGFSTLHSIAAKLNKSPDLRPKARFSTRYFIRPFFGALIGAGVGALIGLLNGEKSKDISTGEYSRYEIIYNPSAYSHNH